MTLLPCAHCGGKAVLNGYNRNQFGGYFVECTACCANVGKNFCGDGEAGGTVEDHSFDTEPEAIAAWNRRAVPEGYALVPVELNHTVKAALIGEYTESCNVSCPECRGEGCDDCDEGVVEQLVTVGWDTTKQIYKDAIKALVEEQLRSKP